MIQPPLSLYVHLPWCVRKCPYCDFNSHTSSGIPEQAYLDSLIKDLDQDLHFVQGREVQTVFFGGGTPSLLSGDFYLRLFEALHNRLKFADGVEITLEANPGTTDIAHFKGYAEAGINRVSLGAQSFNDKQLQALGRIHSSRQIIDAVDALTAAGIKNFNIDLMHGLPDQTPEMAMQDLQEAFALGPKHISWYQLTIEPNTEFFSKPPKLPEEEALWAITEQGAEILQGAGYPCYEISAYARPEWQARHNLNYWQFGDYLGIGAGAHSKITDVSSGGILRYRKSRMPEAYMADRVSYRVGEESLAPEAIPFEFMMNALRLSQGVENALFEQRTGINPDIIKEQIVRLRKEGLMQEDRIQLTTKGQLFLNSILERFL